VAGLRIAYVRRDAGPDTGEDQLFAVSAALMLERGDEVTLVAPKSARVPPGVRHLVVDPLVIGFGTDRRRRAFSRAADKLLKGSTAYDVIVGRLDATVCDIVRVERGCTQTRIDHGQGMDGDDAALEIEKAGLEKGVFRVAVAPSSLVRKDLARRHGLDPAAIRVVDEGVDLERYRPRLRAAAGVALRKEIGLDEPDFVVVLHAGELARTELERVLKVVPEVAKERPKARFVLSGADAETSRSALAAGGGHVRISSQPIGPALLAASDVLVLPMPYSPFHSLTLAALASGVPVITSAMNGASELIEQDVTGSVLTGFQDSQPLYRELAAWTRPERAKEGGRLARAIAEAHGLDAQAVAMIAIVDEVAAMARRK
jgi:glycosyltransferase involved in cell wall biosynthesis